MDSGKQLLQLLATDMWAALALMQADPFGRVTLWHLLPMPVIAHQVLLGQAAMPLKTTNAASSRSCSPSRNISVTVVVKKYEAVGIWRRWRVYSIRCGYERAALMDPSGPDGPWGTCGRSVSATRQPHSGLIPARAGASSTQGPLRGPS